LCLCPPPSPLPLLVVYLGRRCKFDRGRNLETRVCGCARMQGGVRACAAGRVVEGGVCGCDSGVFRRDGVRGCAAGGEGDWAFHGVGGVGCGR